MNSRASSHAASHAESLFARFLEARETDPTLEFESWLVAHSDYQAQLRLHHRNWLELQPLVERLVGDTHSPRDASRASFDLAGRELGDFRLIRPLGRGGMGWVFEAEQVSLHRRVALKLLDDSAFDDARQRERFQREARAGARVNHPNIVAVYGVGEVEGRPFIAQELVEGGRTLHDWIEDERGASELDRVHDAWVAHTFALVADALQAAHEAGVIHRDIKPRNILLRPDGTPKVADFGLVKLATDHSLSRTGDLIGTYHYMSPEQVSGDGQAVGARSDVFSLGVALYEALTLTRPFTGDTPHQILRKIADVDPPDPRTLRSRLPRELALIVGKALEKQRERRYASMREFGADLRRYLAGELVQAREPSARDRTLKWMRRHSLATLAVGATLILAAGGGWGIERVVSAESKYARQQRAASLERLIASLDKVDESASEGREGNAHNRSGEWMEFESAFRSSAFPLDEALCQRLTNALDGDDDSTLRSALLDQLYPAATCALALNSSHGSASTAPRVNVDSAWKTLDQTLTTLETRPLRQRVWASVKLAPLGTAELERLVPRDSWNGLSAVELEWLARRHDESRDHAHLDELLQLAYAKDPSRYWTNLRLATLSTGAVRKLHAYAAVALRPNASFAHYGVAWSAQAIFGDREAAVLHYRKAIELNPGLGEAYANLSLLLDPSSALALLESARARVAPVELFYVQLANRLEFAGRVDESVDVCREGLACFPDSAVLLQSLANGLLLTEPERAIALYERALGLDPRLWGAWSNLGLQQLVDGFRRMDAEGLSEEVHACFERARASSEQAVLLQPENATLIANLGGAYLALDRIDEGVRLLLESIARGAKQVESQLAADVLPALRAESSYADLVREIEAYLATKR